MKISTQTIAKWIDVVRHEKDNRDRILEVFWDSQLESKGWLCERFPSDAKTVVIHGAWYGTLASMLLEMHPTIESITCVDMDPSCERMVGMFNMDNRVHAETCAMQDYIYKKVPDVVINTSCEHLTQEDYDEWYANIPEGTDVILQSNDMFDVDEHVNCSRDLMEFIEKSRVLDITYAGILPLKRSNRFMVISKK